MNQITLPAAELKQALSGLNKIVGRRSTLPVLEHIRLTRDRNGDVNLEATDLDAHAIYHVPESQDGTPLDMLVPFEPLNKLVKGLGSKEVVSFTPDGKNKLKLRYPLGGSFMEQKLNTLATDEFPPLPKITTPDTQLGPEFGVALKQALHCCSNDPTRSVLRGVCMDVGDKKLHYIASTNGRILFSANSFAFNLPQSVIIPDSKFLNWTDLMDDGCKLAVEPSAKKESKGWIRLSSPHWTFITRPIEGPFPNWKRYLPIMASPKTVIKLPSQAVKQLQEVLSHLPGNEDVNHTIRLKYEFGQLKVEGRSKEGDWSGVFIQDTTITGKPVTIGINREYLLFALKFNLNEIQIEDALNPLVCINGGKRIVIMPVKLETAPATKPAPPSTSTPKPPASNPAEERKTEMPRTSAKTEPTQPTETSPTTSVIDKVEKVKETLKTVIHDLNTLLDSVKLAAKEKRASEKEVEAARATLKKLQQVSL